MTENNSKIIIQNLSEKTPVNDERERSNDKMLTVNDFAFYNFSVHFANYCIIICCLKI